MSGDRDGKLTVGAWLLVPFAFVLLVLALSLCVDAVLNAFAWQLTAPSALSGAATAVAIGSGEMVGWHSERQRAWLRWCYPIGFLVLGILIGGLALPSIAILACTVPATALLVAGWRPGVRIEADPTLPSATPSSGTISGTIGGPDITAPTNATGS
ncbi:MAG TPA: hypothetical protein VHX38_22585 [Pseudonocardiaceae bacterium]|jgi:hypothetical protein|nr:hypothetical protein [Pseudonocardiaceae bacterium]